LPALTQNRVARDAVVAGHNNAIHAAYRLQVQQQWLAVPQQLTLQCLDANGVIDEADSERGLRLFIISKPSPSGVSAPVWCERQPHISLAWVHLCYCRHRVSTP
jgi:hypothetical protein